MRRIAANFFTFKRFLVLVLVYVCGCVINETILPIAMLKSTDSKRKKKKLYSLVALMMKHAGNF